MDSFGVNGHKGMTSVSVMMAVTTSVGGCPGCTPMARETSTVQSQIWASWAPIWAHFFILTKQFLVATSTYY
jgi:hypothetical protein